MSNITTEVDQQLQITPDASPEESLDRAYGTIARLTADLENVRNELSGVQPLIDFVKEQEALLYQEIRNQLAQLSELAPLLRQRFVYETTYQERNQQVEGIIDTYCKFIKSNYALLMALRDYPNTDGVRRPLYAGLLELYFPLSARPHFTDLGECNIYHEIDAILSIKVSNLLTSLPGRDEGGQ